jgi:hypothetical protein
VAAANLEGFVMPEIPLTPAERVLRARLGAHRSWATCNDRTARTAPARARFEERFEREVDPDRVLSPAERARRAESARKAYFTNLSLRSARARRAKKATS